MSVHNQEDLKRIYALRFEANLEYRKRIWTILVKSFFSQFVPSDATVLDLGCGYGEFVNLVSASERYAMDLNPDAPRYLDPGISFLHQDCSQPWNLKDSCLDLVFTSNFFEHLPEKAALSRTLDQVLRCLKPGGRLIAMGPNAKFIPGAYWDFWDHHLPLTERALREALETRGFRIECCVARFLPYTMAGKKQTAPFLVELYLAFPFVWRFLGKQFLVVASKMA